GRQRVDRHRPAATPGDGVDVHGEGAAGDHADRLRLSAHPGNASWSMNMSLKSARPDSSTYSTSSRIASAAARSRIDSAAILAPPPATLPAEPMRGSASRGTRPIFTALAGDR